jgi:undecaprenyl-diphosphatase
MFIIAILKAAALGVVEGITEFLPISSTGHMIIADQFLKLPGGVQFTDAFEVIIQGGAILAVVFLFFDRLWPFSGTAEERKGKWILWAKVVVAFLPAAVIGFLSDKMIEKYLFNPVSVAVALAGWGAVIIILETIWKNRTDWKVTDVAKTSFGIALAIGCFQCLSLVPGTSRSAATILGAMVLGLSRPAAAEFSFFLAIPTMFGATVFKLHSFSKEGLHFGGSEMILLATGFIVSFIVAVFVIRLFIGFLKKHDFRPFGWYRIALGALVLVLLVGLRIGG